jgi:hypothetical protein
MSRRVADQAREDAKFKWKDPRKETGVRASIEYNNQDTARRRAIAETKQVAERTKEMHRGFARVAKTAAKRAGVVGAALTGYEIGQEIDKATGASSKIADALLRKKGAAGYEKRSRDQRRGR